MMDIERWERDTRAHLATLSPLERNSTLAAIMAFHVRPGPSTDIYGVEKARWNPMATPYASAFEQAMERLIKDFG